MNKYYAQCAVGILFTVLSLHTQAQRPVRALIDEAQQQQVAFKKTQTLNLEVNPTYRELGDAFARNVTYSKLDLATTHNLWLERNAGIEFSFPYKDGQTITLELVQVNLFADGFGVYTSSSNGLPVSYTPGVYYQGTIKGEPNSIAAISIFEDEIMGVVSSDAEGNINIGRFTPAGKMDYMIYSDQDILVVPENAGCGTLEDPDYIDTFHSIMEQDGSSRITNCPKIYFEADYGLFQNKGSVTATANYVTGIYNNSAVIYTNESVPTSISTIFVWNTSDGYSSASSYSALTDFMNFRTSFTGDIAHLVALDPGGLGGVAATINGLCNSNKYCYSDIDASYSDFPTYSWTVMVVTHEMGHLFGSYHTHNCSAWVGGAIDNCYTTEGGCSPGPAPVGGGTIMSYCHLTGYGINFNNGFGTQPGNAIRNTISSAPCVTSCGGGPTYCVSAGTSTEDEWIQTVNMNGSTNNSGNNGGYEDFTGLTINLNTGVANNFTLTPGFTGPVYSEYFSIWIDYNNDLDFSDAGENVYNSGAVTAAVSSSFVVPSGESGTTRMRISMKYNALATACETFSYGEVEDYTVNFVTPVTYCTSAGTSSATRYIDYVKFSTINRSSGNDGGYYNGTGITANVVKGTSYTLTFSAGFSGTIYQMYWRGWIDYNRDGDFADAGEQIFQKKATTSGNVNKSITIPTTASTGTTRMRISSKYGGFPTSCETFTYGEVEDYTLNILPGLEAGSMPDFSLSVYPNPSDGIFQLEFLNAFEGGLTLQVYDLTGKVVRSEIIESENGLIILDMIEQPAGMYIVKATTADGQIFTERIIRK